MVICGIFFWADYWWAEGVFTAGFAISTVFLCGVSLVICGDFVVETWWLGARF
jgi:hypothetical protein